MIQNFIVILLMVQKSGDHQLRLIVYPVIYRVLAPSQVFVWDFHEQYESYIIIYTRVKVDSAQEIPCIDTVDGRNPAPPGMYKTL